MKRSVQKFDAFDTWLNKQGKSENTIKTYLGILEKFSNWLSEQNRNIHSFTRKDVQGYMNYLESLQRSGATIEKVFAAISVFARFQGKSQLIQNIDRKEKENKRANAPESLEKKERKELIKRIEQDGNLRNTAIVYTLLYTGIRISELCALNQSDVKINDQNGILIIKNSGTERIVPLSKEVLPHLTKYVDSLVSSSDALFLSSFNQRITPRAVQYMLRKYGVHPHKLRHTFCRELIENGTDVSVVAQLAGHSDINVTKRYSKPVKPELESVVESVLA